MAFTGRMRELMKKYGKVALGVHFSVSAASITGLYVVIKNNVDVESLFQKVGLPSGLLNKDPAASSSAGAPSGDPAVVLDSYDAPAPPPPPSPPGEGEEKKRNRTAELAASSGGALALAILCNKALFPVRVPITIALTPPIARFLARRKLVKTPV
ncbi:uncharacterized protein LOC103718901 [Phoenix dactylifera]|uniref:Uncharacterized protein LOC103718901 n=1 Tax=Phoenix dactylifera TaxID=42345 RepID=A0A8B7MW76_PHODC|nr:uncharacterized protein LOC103718901 [Phoenix dactylifera]